MCKPLKKVSRIERCSPKTDIWPINASDLFEFLKSPWGAPTNKDLSSMKHASTVGLHFAATSEIRLKKRRKVKSSSDPLPPSQNWHFVVQLNFHFSSLKLAQLFSAAVVEQFETVQNKLSTFELNIIIITSKPFQQATTRVYVSCVLWWDKLLSTTKANRNHISLYWKLWACPAWL